MAVAERVAHPFEVAGLGAAPFHCFGSYESKFRAIPGDPHCPVQPGSSCDYCGSALMYVFAVRSSDGKEFKVGSDCILKVHKEIDTTLPVDVRVAIEKMNQDRRRQTRERRWQKEADKRREVQALFAQHPALFTDSPHPNDYYASEGRTLRDYYEWHLGRPNAAQVKRIERAILESVGALSQ